MRVITLCVRPFYTAFSWCYIVYFHVVLMFLKGTFNNEYIKQVKRESHLNASKDDHKMQCILEALQVQIHKSKK